VDRVRLVQAHPRIGGQQRVHLPDQVGADHRARRRPAPEPLTTRRRGGLAVAGGPTVLGAQARAQDPGQFRGVRGRCGAGLAQCAPRQVQDGGIGVADELGLDLAPRPRRGARPERGRVDLVVGDLDEVAPASATQPPHSALCGDLSDGP
jgi:hypothetical protein